MVGRLDDGLTQLRNLLLTRITEDVERSFGVDSMIVPLSQARTEHVAKGEIEALLVAEVADEASLGGLVALPAEWIRQWLLDLRLAGRQDGLLIVERVELYLGHQPRKRYLEFSDMLERVLPEARHAPLVLYQLFPLAVRASATVAFGNHQRGAEIRAKQRSLHPPIEYCRICRGRLMDVDESCRECGNPLWTIRWLTQAD